MRIHRIKMGITLSGLCLQIAPAIAAPCMMQEATQEEWPIKWYIPPDAGPVVGNQNGWFVTPWDILPGELTFSGQVENAKADSFEMTPNSVWGNNPFKISRSSPSDARTPDLKLHQIVSVRSIHFADLDKLSPANTLLFSGTLKAISADHKRFTAEMDFNEGPVSCQLELIRLEEKKIPF